MSHDLDDRLRRLAVSPPDRDLDLLEPAVWSRVSARRAERAEAAAVRPFAAAGVAGALVFGLVAGGLSLQPSESSELAVFSPHAALAPSTLLGG
ncbi:MAG TPA: hypothetical protein VF699_01790 [Caulobacteraceae bacterium]|jgi:hypothetical protein